MYITGMLPYLISSVRQPHQPPVEVIIVHSLVGFDARHVKNGHRRAIHSPQGTRVHHRQLRYLVAVIGRSSPRESSMFMDHVDHKCSIVQLINYGSLCEAIE